MTEDNTDRPPMEPPVEVPDQPLMEPLAEVPPVVYPLVTIESKLLGSTWLVIGAVNDYVMTTGNIRVGRDLVIDSSKLGVPLEDLNEEINRRIDLVHSVHGPFRDHINEMFDLFESSCVLILSRLLVKLKPERVLSFMNSNLGTVDPVMGWSHCVKRSIIRSSDRIGYESQRRL